MVPYGLKKNETRGWGTSRRGPLVIHAAKRPARAHELAVDAWNELHAASKDRGDDGNLPYGALLGIVNLIDCVRVEDIRAKLTHRERRWGNYEDGRFAWRLELVHAFTTPIPYRGAQGLFEVPLVERDGTWMLDPAPAPAPTQMDLLR